jgi:hypothetical protein
VPVTFIDEDIMVRPQQQMPIAGAITMTMLALIACGASPDGSRSVSGEVMRAAAAVEAATVSHDPCALLAASEAEPFVGRLSTPPYRSDGERPAKDGDECVYAGAQGRQVVVKPHASGGRMTGAVMKDVPELLGKALGKSAPGMDSIANRVMQQAPTGPWDKATWIPGGSLFVSKGNAMIVVDVSGAGGKEADAIAMAKLMMPRIEHPLPYDGAKAVALAPAPVAHPTNACAFVPRATVEAAIGTLAGEPKSDGGAGCTYTVRTNAGVRTYPVEFVWEGGRRNYNMLKHGMSTVSGMIGTADGAGLDSIPANDQMKQMIGGLMKLANGGDRSAATGAASKVGLKTDTTLAGPWDSASLLHGTQLIAVRRDVMVGMSLESADYDRAHALLVAICSRL